jgi:tetratricopeptide (TPR) repeat protein
MELFKTDGEKKEELIKKALSCADSGDYLKAVKGFEAILDLFPGDEDVLCNLGFVYSDMQEYGPAYDIFKKLIYINPHYIEAFNNLGLIFASQEKYSDAIFIFEKGIENNPSAAVLYNNLGNIYFNTGKFDKALLMFKKTGELTPLVFEHFFHLGLDSFLSGSGSMAEAIVKLQESAKQNFNKAKTVHDLGIAYTDRHMTNKAIDSFLNAVNIYPDYLSAFINLGSTYQQKEEYEKAILAFERALVLNPNNAKIYNITGMLYDNMDKPDMAIKMYKEAVRLDPTYADSHYVLGQLYQNRGSFDKAVAEFTKHITGATVDDAMRRISAIKSSTFEDVKEFFTLFASQNKNKMPDNEPVLITISDPIKNNHVNNVNGSTPVQKKSEDVLLSQDSLQNGHIHDAAHLNPLSGHKIPLNPPAVSQKKPEPSAYMKIVQEKIKPRTNGENQIPAPPPPMFSAGKLPDYIALSQPVLDLLNDLPANNIFKLPPRPEDDLRESRNIIETKIEAPAADNEYKHSQETAENPFFDSGVFSSAPEIVPNGPANISKDSADKSTELKKHPKPLPMIPVEPTHGSSIQPVGSVTHMQNIGPAAMAPRHPISPAPQRPAPPDKNQDGPAFILDDDDKKKKTKPNNDYY